MPKILELDPHVADLIAAGEVVERPASVVKELLENSIDAGAKIITVEIQAGGMTYIRVTDNGCGIGPEDAKTAFLRHATSKLRDAEGLEAIGTLGFRGEALAAIAAVSQIELLTRVPGAAEGVCLTIKAGTVTEFSPAGCPEGANIIVRDLFFNTPARLKFVKSDRSESSAVASAVLRIALSRPDVSIRFIRDGKTEFHTPGDSRADSCIYSLLGREFSAGLIPASSSDGSVSVSGFVSSPAAARGNRSYQFFFVNGRSIQSRTLQAALEQAYANKIQSGRYPSCVLYITTSLGAVDVNVHPAKTEVKFVSDKQVFDGVYYAALSANQGAGIRDQGSGTRIQGSRVNGQDSAYDVGGHWPSVVGDGVPDVPKHSSGYHPPVVGDGVPDVPKETFKSMSADEYRKTYGGGKTGNANWKEDRRGGYYPPVAGDGVKTGSGKWREERGELSVSEPVQPSDYAPKISTFNVPLSTLESPPSADNSQLSTFNSQLSKFRVIGEAMKTYIIVDYQNSVWFIDKHAAHERICFDALSSAGYEPMPQSLITPVICRHGQEDTALLLENAEILEKLGFYVESFGDDAIAVREIPFEIDIADVEQVLSEICAQLSFGGTPTPAQRDSILRSIACKAAIKAGRSSEKIELETLAARVFSGEVELCPHGRPVAFEIKRTTLERNFKRI